MTTYHIEHRTTYTYDSEVTGSYGQVHLRPRDLAWQTCMAHEISIDPEPADLFRHIDLYGNEQAYFHVVRAHTRLVVTSTSVVNVEVNDLDPGPLTLPWEQAFLVPDKTTARHGKPPTSPSRPATSRYLGRYRTTRARPFLPDARSGRLSWSSCIASMATSGISRAQRA